MKRQRDAAEADEIIGIETTDGGRVWYFHRSTLVNVGGYFAARFGDGNIPAGSERIDEHGRSVYFIERDGELFGKHIRPYVLTNDPGDLPPFSEAPRLWRALREEARYYALDGLSEMLYVTHVCDKDDPLGRGVLYYLGTNKGKEDYQNPHARGAVTVGGWPSMSREELEVLGLGGEYYDESETIRAMSPSSLQVLVQYRPPVIGPSELDACLDSRDRCYILPCEFSTYRIPVLIDLITVSVYPRAYTFRHGQCYGARNWNFECSENGTEWTVLHEARNDPHLVRPPPDEYEERFYGLSADELLSFTEQTLRHTWNIELPSPRFFRYFRIIGIGMEDEDFSDAVCMHAVGLEIFGDIHEE